jgi:ABC-type transport system involved in multi-copper enzyme maturation permease subunit
MTFGILWLVAGLLTLVQLLAALPWLASLDLDAFRTLRRRPVVWGYSALTVVGGGFLLAVFLLLIQDRDSLELWGRLYGAVLQAQLVADGLVLGFALILRFWPRGGAVALAAFREGVRQPLFWLVAGLSTLALIVSLVLPYYTFGDDLKMMKHVDHDLLMLAASVFGIIAAGVSISEEIEGRTAITLMSKPVSRRQFLLGKFIGIVLAALALTAVLSLVFQWSIFFRPILDGFYGDYNDPIRDQVQPLLTSAVDSALTESEAHALLRGVALWVADGLALVPGLLIGFGQAMLFVALASALATRLPMAVNIVACLLVYFAGHLAPVLLQVAQSWQGQYVQAHGGQSNATYELVQFVAQMMDTLLPALEYFNLGPAIVRDQSLPLGAYSLYVGGVLLNSLMYTVIALLVGLLLFEDRDLA